MTGDRSAEALLQSLMQDICLRRKKDMKFVDLKLPKKTEYLHRITFHPEEKTKYDALLCVLCPDSPTYCLLTSLIDPRPEECWRIIRQNRGLDRKAASKMSWSAFFDSGNRESLLNLCYTAIR